MKLDSDKPRQNTLLILLTMFDLIAAAAGAMPFAMFSMISNSTDVIGNSNFPLIMSVPIVAVVLVITAWIMDTIGHPKMARLTAAAPLLWGMTVLVTLNGPSI